MARQGASAESSTEEYGGYRGTKWGMTPEEVSSVLPGVQVGDGKLLLVEDEPGQATTTIFHFYKGRLSQIGVVFREEHDNKNRFVEDFRGLKAILSEQYGEPAKESEQWTNPLYRDTPSSWGLAVSVGHLALRSAWETDSTSVLLTCSGEGSEILLMLSYTSKELAAAQAAEVARQQADYIDARK